LPCGGGQSEARLRWPEAQQLGLAPVWPDPDRHGPTRGWVPGWSPNGEERGDNEKPSVLLLTVCQQEKVADLSLSASQQSSSRVPPSSPVECMSLFRNGASSWGESSKRSLWASSTLLFVHALPSADLSSPSMQTDARTFLGASLVVDPSFLLRSPSRVGARTQGKHVPSAPDLPRADQGLCMLCQLLHQTEQTPPSSPFRHRHHGTNSAPPPSRKEKSSPVLA
jgi:hypothetical protein